MMTDEVLVAKLLEACLDDKHKLELALINIRKAFYVDGTRKALLAAIEPTKALLPATKGA